MDVVQPEKISNWNLFRISIFGFRIYFLPQKHENNCLGINVGLVEFCETRQKQCLLFIRFRTSQQICNVPISCFFMTELGA